MKGKNENLLKEGQEIFKNLQRGCRIEEVGITDLKFRLLKYLVDHHFSGYSSSILHH